jgi:energy-coupling factor transport system permease protein
MSGSTSRRPVVLLRPVPGTSVIHELWAGTKIIAVFVISMLLTFLPTWTAIATVAALVVVTARLARIPRGAVPTVPIWMVALVIGGSLSVFFSGGAPFVHIGTITIGLHGALAVARTTAVAVVLLGAGAMVSWTTNVSEVAPAVALMGRPLKRLGVPVDERAATLALSLRAFPMLVDEFRVLMAARRLRPREVTDGRRRLRWVAEVVDILTAAITVALRRASEMGDAITARGGTGQIAAHPARPGAHDAIALLVIAAVTVGVVLFEVVL